MDVWSARGKPGIVFNPSKGYADRHFQLPCGYCMQCQFQRSADWGIRCVHESQMHDANSFITLTYATPYLPEGASLDIRDIQLFLKRLRKRLGKIRFLHCGEYGTEFKRPHSHLCLFGEDFTSDRVRIEDSHRGYPQWMSAKLSEIWPLGRATISEFKYSSAQYVAQYTVKRAPKTDADAYHRYNSATGDSWYVRPEFITCSTHPGIGALWFQKYWREIYPDDLVVIDGIKRRPPKYYDLLLSRSEPDLWNTVRKSRTAQAISKQKAEILSQAQLARRREALTNDLDDGRKRDPEMATF